MLYNNDPKKVEALDQMLFEKFGTDREYEDKECYFEDYQHDYLLRVIYPKKLDELIAAVAKAIECGNDRDIHKALRLTNPPVLYNKNLVLGMDKYLHWFRGYYYQVSYTPDGIGAVNTPYYRMLEPMEITRRTNYYVSEYKGAAEFILSMSALTTALNYYDRVMELLSTEEGIKEFDQFLSENYLKHNSGTMDFNTHKVLERFSEETCDAIPSDILVNNVVLLGHDVSMISASSGKQTVAILSISKDNITVVTKLRDSYRKVEFAFPDWYTDIKGLYAEEFDENPYKESHYTLGSFVQFVLLYAGVRFSSTGFYLMRKDVDKKHPIIANIPVVWDASQLDDVLEQIV